MEIYFFCNKILYLSIYHNLIFIKIKIILIMKTFLYKLLEIMFLYFEIIIKMFSLILIIHSLNINSKI